MKKLFLLAILLLSVTSASAQFKQFRCIYTETYIPTAGEEVTWRKNETVFIFNYNGEARLKIYGPKNNVIDLKMVSDVEKGETENGTKYSGADYIDNEGNEIYVQKFDEEKHGTRFIFNDGTSVEFR